MLDESFLPGSEDVVAVGLTPFDLLVSADLVIVFTDVAVVEDDGISDDDDDDVIVVGCDVGVDFFCFVVLLADDDGDGDNDIGMVFLIIFLLLLSELAPFAVPLGPLLSLDVDGASTTSC